MRRIELTDDVRAAETVLAIPRTEIAQVIRELARAKRLSAVVARLNQLTNDPAHHAFGRRALQHLGFSDA